MLRSGVPELRRWAGLLAAAGAWQVASGLSNVVLGWPLVAAVAHTGGAAALAAMLTLILAGHRGARRGVDAGLPATVSATAAS
jgi:cytochrome c oxidase assembly protein subunit 15